MSGKIATELEARLIGNKDGGFPSDVKCCSAIRASSFGCEYPSEYSGYRLVPKNVLTASAPRFMFYGTKVVTSPFLQLSFSFENTVSCYIFFNFSSYSASSSTTTIFIDRIRVKVVNPQSSSTLISSGTHTCEFNCRDTNLYCEILFNINTSIDTICTITGKSANWNPQTEWN